MWCLDNQHWNHVQGRRTLCRSGSSQARWHRPRALPDETASGDGVTPRRAATGVPLIEGDCQAVNDRSGEAIKRIRLNVGAWQMRSVANGPGERFVLWLQGCPLGCPGCFNAQFQPFVRRHVLTVEEAAEMVLAVTGIEGITYTGGEPMVQAPALAILSERLREAGLTVLCYTGLTLEALHARKDPWVERLLSCVDVLIDGPYIREKAANLLWRGSTNQRVHFRTEAYRHLAGRVDKCGAEVELSVDRQGFTATGTWPQGFLGRLEEALRR
jgi:anaerobic ribonucleoside-triphosphate reductase activating protein